MLTLLFIHVHAYNRGELTVMDGKGGTVGPLSYEQLFNAVSKALFKAHVEGRLKADVMKDPERCDCVYV